MKPTTGKQIPKRGDVFWVAFDPSQGTEIQKTRPAIILSNNFFNKNLSRVIVAPITSNVKNIFDFDCSISLLGKEGKIMLDQLRTIDKSRLRDKITSVEPYILEELDKALKLTFDLI